MSAFKLIPVGTKFHRLTVIGSPIRITSRSCSYPCQCECGVKKIVSRSNLTHGGTKSCGCLLGFKNTTHGDSRTRLYSIWFGIKVRCLKKSNHAYKYYGGRGITISEEFSKYEAFRAWALANGYTDKLSIDRINNDGNYSPENCRWTDQVHQVRNSRQARNLNVNGESHCISEWTEVTGLKCTTIGMRLKRGWTEQEAVTLPLGSTVKVNRKSNTSGFRGVHWSKKYSVWVSQIGFNGIGIHVGHFDSAEEAARAYDRKSREINGANAILNFKTA